ncbi:novel interactor of JAZ, partial [Striga asiatica]
TRCVGRICDPLQPELQSPPPAAVSIGLTADGLPVGEPMMERAQWSSNIFSSLLVLEQTTSSAVVILKFVTKDWIFMNLVIDCVNLVLMGLGYEIGCDARDADDRMPDLCGVEDEQGVHGGGDGGGAALDDQWTCTAPRPVLQMKYKYEDPKFTEGTRRLMEILEQESHIRFLQYLYCRVLIKLECGCLGSNDSHKAFFGHLSYPAIISEDSSGPTFLH